MKRYVYSRFIPFYILLVVLALIIILLSSCAKETFHDQTWGDTHVMFINSTQDTIVVHVSYDGFGGYCDRVDPNDTLSFETWRHLGRNAWTTLWQQTYRIEWFRSGVYFQQGEINQFKYDIR